LPARLSLSIKSRLSINPDPSEHTITERAGTGDDGSDWSLPIAYERSHKLNIM